MDELIQQLKVAFANTFVFHAKAWGYHWNVEGADFYEFHKLFEEIYSEVQGSVDPFAEHIRQLQSYAPGTLERFKQLSEVQESTKIPTAMEMANDLLTANETILGSLQSAYDLAEANKEHALSNFLADRMEAHKKHAWFLRSTLKNR